MAVYKILILQGYCILTVSMVHAVCRKHKIWQNKTVFLRDLQSDKFGFVWGFFGVVLLFFPYYLSDSKDGVKCMFSCNCIPRVNVSIATLIRGEKKICNLCYLSCN